MCQILWSWKLLELRCCNQTAMKINTTKKTYQLKQYNGCATRRYTLYIVNTLMYALLSCVDNSTRTNNSNAWHWACSICWMPSWWFGLNIQIRDMIICTSYKNTNTNWLIDYSRKQYELVVILNLTMDVCRLNICCLLYLILTFLYRLHVVLCLFLAVWLQHRSSNNTWHPYRLQHLT